MLVFNLVTQVTVLYVIIGFIDAAMTQTYFPKSTDGRFCVIPFIYNRTTQHDCLPYSKTERWCPLVKIHEDQSPLWISCAPHPSEFSGCPLATPNVDLQEVEEILLKHNYARAQIPAQRMRKMEWNVELAYRAQEAANRCSQRYMYNFLCGDRQDIAQNYYIIYDKIDYPNYIPWSQVIDSWIQQGKDYNIKTLKCAPGKMCYNYIQMISHNSGEIGCGKAQCQGPLNRDMNKIRYYIQYYCNYFEVGNYDDNPPYKETTGDRCQECYLYDPNRYFRCDPNQLCEACANDKRNCSNLAAIKKKVSEGLLCADTMQFCELYKNLCELKKSGQWMPTEAVNVIQNCKKTCKLC